MTHGLALLLALLLLCTPSAKPLGWQKHRGSSASNDQHNGSRTKTSSLGCIKSYSISDISSALNRVSAAPSIDSVDRAIDVIKLSTDVQKASLSMMAIGLSSDGKSVDYGALRASEEFSAYQTIVAGLRSVDLSALARCTDAQRSVFFINLYNSLVVHANIVVGPPVDSPEQRSLFFSGQTGAFYDVGGSVFSPDDIEHGVLRSNALHRSTHNGFDDSKRFFREGDSARGALALAQTDCRIHFVLNCGAVSCPPIRILSEKNLERAMALASSSYLCSEAMVKVGDDSQATLLLPKLLLWYGKDFGKNKQEMLAKVMELTKDSSCGEGSGTLYNFLAANRDRLGDIDIEWRGYDWRLNNA